MNFTKSRYLSVSSGHTDALIDYVLDVKPYHTKLSEIVERYELNDDMNVKIGEMHQILAFLGADILESSSLIPGVRSRRTNSWWRELSSDGSKTIWPMPLTSVHKFFSHAGREVFVAGVNDDAQIPGITDSASRVFSPTRFDGNSISNVRKNGIHQQESYDYFLSHGAFSFQTRANAKWKESNVAHLTAFSESDGALIYEDVLKQSAKVINILRGDFDEWTLTCTNATTGIVTVSGKRNGIIGDAAVGSTFNHPLLQFELAAPAEDEPHSLTIGETFTLTPSSKITVAENAPQETWTLIKTNPIVIEAKPLLNGQQPAAGWPNLAIHTSSLDKVKSAASWSVRFGNGGTYTITKISTDNPFTVQASLSDGLTYKDEHIHFTIIPGSQRELTDGDVFDFVIGDTVDNYLVYGSTSGWQPNAKVGEWYWNGKIGFKIPKLECFAFIKAGSSFIRLDDPRFVQINNVHSNAQASTYVITFRAPVDPNTQVLHATVVNNIRGYQKGLTIGEVWEDEFCSFQLNASLNNQQFSAGDVVYVYLATPKTYAIVDNPFAKYDTAGYDTMSYDTDEVEDIDPNDNYDVLGYDALQYDTDEIDITSDDYQPAIREATVPWLLNEEYFPLYHSHNVLIFKEGVAANDRVIIDKALKDVVRFRIDAADSLYPELASVDGWIPLEFRYFDTANSFAHFPDLTTRIEAYLCSDPTVKVFTIDQPRYGSTNRNSSATLKIDNDFFAKFLPFGTKFSLRSQPDSSYGQKIHVKTTENLRVFARIRLDLADGPSTGHWLKKNVYEGGSWKSQLWYVNSVGIAFYDIINGELHLVDEKTFEQLGYDANDFTLKFPFVINFSNEKFSSTVIFGEKLLEDRISVRFIEGGALPITLGYDDLGYDAAPYDLMPLTPPGQLIYDDLEYDAGAYDAISPPQKYVAVIPQLVNIAPGIFESSTEPGATYLPRPIAGPGGIHIVDDTVETTGTSFTESFSFSEKAALPAVSFTWLSGDEPIVVTHGLNTTDVDVTIKSQDGEVISPTLYSVVLNGSQQLSITPVADLSGTILVKASDVSRLSVMYDFSQVSPEGLLIEQQADQYLITHNVQLQGSGTYIVDSTQIFPSVLSVPHPSTTTLGSFSFSLPAGLTAPFRLRII